MLCKFQFRKKILAEIKGFNGKGKEEAIYNEGGY